MIRTDNPIADFLAHEAEQEKALRGLPVCFECRHPIQTEELFDFDGKLICPNCLDENHLKPTDDYIRES